MIPKPGYKTTEFWVTTLTSIAALVASLTSNLKPEYATFGAAISEGLYALSRAVTKHGVATAHRVTATSATATPTAVVPPAQV